MPATSRPSRPSGSALSSLPACVARGLAGLVGLAGLLAVAAAPAGAQPPRQAERPAEGAAEAAEAPAPPPEERVSTTRHRLSVDGPAFDYTATAGTLLLKEEDGTAKATIFYIAYTKDGADSATRPLTFSFNGGPGSSSVWLHLGTLGPRRVVMGTEGEQLAPPYELAENPFSLLDVTDLVFIDPVSTGFSRPVPGEEADQFHGLEQDVESVGEFVRRWVAANGRWDSPKFLIGESYGTTRAAALVEHLQGRHGMYFNGAMLVSSILNFGTARFDVGNDLPYILFLPTYTATAWYHGRLPEGLGTRSLEEVLEEAEAFALGDYASALLQGSRLPTDERERIAERLARYTGLSVDYLLSAHLRPSIFRFTKELLRDQGQTVGRLDSRFVGYDRDAAGERFEYDPSYAAIQGHYTAALNDYVRDELGFDSDLDYEILGGRIRRWDYSDFENRYVNVADRLREAMTRNPHLQVHVANGYYDLATPYFATEYTFDHLMLPEHLQGNVTMSYYPSGHMMYIRDEDAAKLEQALETFIRRATARE